MSHWPFEVVEKDGSPLIKVQYLGESKTFSPQEISSMVLTKMKEISEAKLGKTIKKAVVTLVYSHHKEALTHYFTGSQHTSMTPSV
jgi:L1 cell adhesion molecule like protein